MHDLQDFSPATKPLPHQRDAIEYIVSHPAVALFDEQGLGKTKIVIDAFSELMRQGLVDAALIVAPMTLLYNWEQEIQKHSHLLPVVLRGNRRERKYRMLSGANFYIVNYESLVVRLDVFRKLCRSRRFAVALDESTRIKDPSTETAQALYTIAESSVRRVIMTGTPVANRPEDLWGQFFFLDEGELLGTDFRAFVARFDEHSPSFTQELEKLHSQLKSNSIRRLKADVLSLPDKLFISHQVTLAGDQRDSYRRCAEELIVELKNMSGETYAHEIDNVLEKLLRLVQLSSNPGLLDPRYSGPNAKFEYLDQLLPNLLESSEKLILWSSFVGNVTSLATRFGHLCPLVIHGAVSIKERAQIVRAFQEDEVHRLLIANPAAAREGLTLTRASAAVYVDRTFSLTDYLQSQDRIHRIGQDRTCEIHKLVASGTVDEYVDLVIDLKQSIAEFIYASQADARTRIPDLLRDREELLRFIEEGAA